MKVSGCDDIHVYMSTCSNVNMFESGIVVHLEELEQSL